MDRPFKSLLVDKYLSSVWNSFDEFWIVPIGRWHQQANGVQNEKTCFRLRRARVNASCVTIASRTLSRNFLIKIGQLPYRNIQGRRFFRAPPEAFDRPRNLIAKQRQPSQIGGIRARTFQRWNLKSKIHSERCKL